MNNRIKGFDFARAYAIFGMFIVNFTFAFGSFGGKSFADKIVFQFIGNATSIFIILAGIGLVLMSNKLDSTLEEKKIIRSKILKRSWFLVAIGLILYSWWPGDILHFYGGYLHFAVLLLFIPKHYYLIVAISVIVIYHLLQFVIPIETGWDYSTSKYLDFWTFFGFLRNTFYNGWNSIFPWFAYFLVGMFLGKLNWKEKKVKWRLFFVSLLALLVFKGLKMAAAYGFFSEKVNSYFLTEYNPIVFPFMIITASTTILAILFCLFIASRFPKNKLINYLSIAGSMSLSLYIFHITVGMLLFSFFAKRTYTGFYTLEIPISSEYILIFVILFYTFCVTCCVIWSKFFSKGPVELLMRKISG